MEAGEKFHVEMWESGQWNKVLTLISGVDFANGATDYGFVKIDNTSKIYQNKVNIRFRCEGSDPTDIVHILNVSIYARYDSSLGKPKDLEDSLMFQNFKRRYMVHLPPIADTSTKLPLVISLHGGSGDMKRAQGFSMLNPIADKYNFVVAWTQGYGVASPGYSWADDRNTSADQLGVDDVGFIGDLLDTLIRQHRIDTTRIFACGYSNGGFMVQRLGCDYSNRFSALASLGSSMDTIRFKSCKPLKAIPMAFFNGNQDPAMP